MRGRIDRCHLLKVSFNRTILGSDRGRGFDVGTCKLRAGDMQEPVIEYRSRGWGEGSAAPRRDHQTITRPATRAQARPPEAPRAPDNHCQTWGGAGNCRASSLSRYLSSRSSVSLQGIPCPRPTLRPLSLISFVPLSSNKLSWTLPQVSTRVWGMPKRV